MFHIHIPMYMYIYTCTYTWVYIYIPFFVDSSVLGTPKLVGVADTERGEATFNPCNDFVIGPRNRTLKEIQ